MKRKKAIVLIADMKQRLQSIMHYDNPDEAFNILLYGYGNYAHHAPSWRYGVIKAGYLSAYIAHDFAIYVGYPIDKKGCFYKN